MAKITIETKKDNKLIVTYDTGSIVYPICEVSEEGFNISKITNNLVISLVADTIHQCGASLIYQVNKQRFANKTLNKSTDSK